MTWTGGGGADARWSNAANWSTSPSLPEAGADLVFAGTNIAANNDRTDVVSYNSISFSSGSSNIAIAGNGIAISNGITVASGVTGSAISSNIAMAGVVTVEVDANAALSISGDISGGNYLAKSGPGTLTLSGDNTYTGGTTIDAGTLKLGSSTALVDSPNGLLVNGSDAVLDLGGNSITVGSVGLISGSIVNTSATAATLTGSSYMLINGTIGVPLCGANVPVLKGTAGAVTLTAANTYTGPTTVYAGTLTLGGSNAWNPILNGGGADIQDGKIIFNYTSGADPASQILADLHTSYGTPTGPHFVAANGAEIFSSTAAANSSALGWSDNASTSQVTIARTLYGDADLNSHVGLSDLNVMLSNYNNVTGTATWAMGDFNYNGNVTLADLNLVMSYYSGAAGSLPPQVLEIARLGASTTSANSVQFVVVFSEGVTGVDTTTFSDFALDCTDTTGAIASIDDCSDSHAAYLVTVNVYGNGTLGLNLADDNHSIIDANGITIAGTGNHVTGPVYTITTGPAVPTDLTATPVSTTRIDLSWTDADTSQTGYQIDRSTDGGTTWAPLATVTNPNTKSYSNTGLTEGVPYYYRVQATDAVAASDYATTAAAPLLATPTGLQVTAISGSAVSLQWADNSANESGYAILQLVDGDWQEIGWTDPNATTATVEGTFEPSTEQNFQVQAQSDWSNSAPSNTAVTAPVAWPNAPTDLTTNAVSGTEIDLSWTASTGATSYSIEMQKDGDDTWSVIGATTAPQTTFAATGLSAGGTDYSFRVAAVNSAGSSAFATSSDIPTPNQAPTVATPTPGANPVTGTSTTLSAVATDDGGEANLTYSWSVVSSPAAGDAWFSDNDTNDAKNTTVTFYAAGNYQFQVTVTDALGASVTSSTLNVTVNQTISSIVVTPDNQVMWFGAPNCYFQATGTDQFGNSKTQAFTWSLGTGGVGSILSGTSWGSYSAPTNDPPNDATFTVVASYGGVSGTANVFFEHEPGWLRFDSVVGAGTPSRYSPYNFTLWAPAEFRLSDSSFSSGTENVYDVYDNGSLILTATANSPSYDEVRLGAGSHSQTVI